jgi:hypothetical protein
MATGGKSRRLGHIFLLVLFLVTIVGADVVVSPESLTIGSIEGADVTRTVLLSSTQNETTNIQIVSGDLQKEDGSAVVPAANIQPEMPGHSLNASEMMSVPVLYTFNKTGPGTYTGSLVITYPDGKVLVPTTVKLKADVWLPGILLAIMVIISVYFFYYNTRVRAKDQVLNQVRFIQENIMGDPELKGPIGEPFWNKINGELNNTLVSVKSENLTSANESLKKADGYFKQWAGARDIWVKELDWFIQLQHLLDDLINSVGTGSIPYLDDLHQDFVLFWINIPDTFHENDGTDKLNDKIQEFRHTIENLSKIVDNLDEIKKILENIRNDEPRKEESQKHFDSFWDRLSKLSKGPGQEAAIQQLSSDIVTEYQKLVKKPVPGLFGGTGSPYRKDLKDRKVTDNVTFTPVKPPAGLYIAMLYTYAIAGFALFGTGLGTLYYANPVFGASVVDYISLILWGLGVGPVTNSIQQKIQDVYTNF